MTRIPGTEADTPPGMGDESLIAKKHVDGFTSESPIRAFTEFKQTQTIAIGKGFRPSMAHLHTYLDAMERKEGWRFVQALLPRDNDGDPTILFQKVPPGPRTRRAVAADVMTPATAERVVGKSPAPAAPYGGTRFEPGEAFGTHTMREAMPVLSAIADTSARLAALGDPVNPRHYDGRRCADIGERLSANGFQMLKYAWRLGEKDDACIEIGKAIWYCESEIALFGMLPTGTILKPITAGIKATHVASFLEERIDDRTPFVQGLARMLWDGYNRRRLHSIYEHLREHRFHLDCGRGLAI